MSTPEQKPCRQCSPCMTYPMHHNLDLLPCHARQASEDMIGNDTTRHASEGSLQGINRMKCRSIPIFSVVEQGRGGKGYCAGQCIPKQPLIRASLTETCLDTRLMAGSYISSVTCPELHVQNKTIKPMRDGICDIAKGKGHHAGGTGCVNRDLAFLCPRCHQ